MQTSVAQIEPQNTEIQKCPIPPISKFVTFPAQTSMLTPVILKTTKTTSKDNNIVAQPTDPNNVSASATATHSPMTLDLSAATALLGFTSSTAAITPVTPEFESPQHQGIYLATSGTSSTLKHVFSLTQSGTSNLVSSTPSQLNTQVDLPDQTKKSIPLTKDDPLPSQMSCISSTITSNSNHSTSAHNFPNTPVTSTSCNLSPVSSPPSLSEAGPSLCETSLSINDPQPTSASDIEAFAKFFKQRRISLGFTQEEVGIALGTLYGNMYSQTTICRFEVLQLSFKKMCALKILLQKWLEDATEKVGDGGVRKRKKRMSIDAAMKAVLESHYVVEKRPKSEEISKIAAEMQLDREVIRVWFCNRRQKERKMLKVLQDDVKEEPLDLLPVKQTLENADDVLKQGCQKLLSYIKEEMKC